MKIIHAVGWFFPENLGGTEVYVAALSQRMMSTGHGVGVVAPSTAIRSRSNYVHDAVNVHRYAIPLALSREEAQGRRPLPGAGAFAEIIAEERPDVVHFHTFCTGLGVDEVKAAKRTGALVVATNHLPSLGYICQRGTLMRWGEYPCDGVCRTVKCAACELQHKGMGKKMALSTAVAGLAFRHTEKLLPESRVSTALLMPDLIEHNQKLQAELVDLLDCFVFLNRRAMGIALANGADSGKTRLSYLATSHLDSSHKPDPASQPTTKPIRIGYLGRLTEEKGVLDIARAVKNLPRDIELLVEARGPRGDLESARVSAEVTRIMDGDTRFELAPALSRSEVPAALMGYDVLCIPSRGFENGPTVLLESHAVGTPVVGTKIGAMPELIRAGVDGDLINPGDWRALSELFGRMANDPAGTIDVWRRSIPPVRHMDDVADEYIALYRELLDVRRN